MTLVIATRDFKWEKTTGEDGEVWVSDVVGMETDHSGESCVSLFSKDAEHPSDGWYHWHDGCEGDHIGPFATANTAMADADTRDRMSWMVHDLTDLMGEFGNKLSIDQFLGIAKVLDCAIDPDLVDVSGSISLSRRWRSYNAKNKPVEATP